MRRDTIALRGGTRFVAKLALGAALFLLSIELLAAIAGLPGIRSIGRGAMVLWQQGVLAHDIQVSSARWLLGWLVGSAVGVLVGLLTGRSRTFELSLEGLLILFRAIPFVSLLPLAIRLFGINETKSLFLVSWASGVTSWVIVHQSAQLIPAQARWRAISLGLSKTDWILRVVLPGCGSGIKAALRTSLALALLVVAVAEMSGVYERSSGLWWSEGLGYRLFQSLDAGRDDLLLASILVFTVVGIVGDQLFVGAWALTRRTLYRLRRRAVLQLLHHEVETTKAATIAVPAATCLETTIHEASYNGHVVIRGLSLKIEPGQTLAVVGESGCGKTTLIRAIAGLDNDTLRIRKRLLIDREEVTNPGSWAGIVFQEATVFGHLTVWDNIAIVGRLKKLRRIDRIRVTTRLLEEFGLTSVAHHRASDTSGGQRQRLALAATLANAPRVALAR